jgi:hypothetical protein
VRKPVFKPEFYRELARDNPLGLTLHWHDAEAWFNFIAWPRYKTYNYKRHHQTVRRWWANLSMRDLDRARDAMENVKIEVAQLSQRALEITPAFYVPDNPALIKILGGKRD